MEHERIPAQDEALVKQIIGAAIEVHRALGPGFIELIYKRAMCHALSLRGVPFTFEKEISIPYKDALIPGQRYDLLVGERILTELKAVTELHPLYEAKVPQVNETSSRPDHQFPRPAFKGWHFASGPLTKLFLCVVCALCGSKNRAAGALIGRDFVPYFTNSETPGLK